MNNIKLDEISLCQKSSKPRQIMTPTKTTWQAKKVCHGAPIAVVWAACSAAFVILVLVSFGSAQQAGSGRQLSLGQHQDYYYSRTRKHPNHLRISEDYKNNYADEVKLESTINGTKWEYYKAHNGQVASFDELVFETIDKIFRHRLSPFYIHHYDSDDDKRRSFDRRRVSPELCARDLLYLLDKLHAHGAEQARMAPELSAFFDSYARPESGVLLGNTYWVGAHEQCVTRHVFDLIDESSRGQAGAGQPTKRHAVSFGGRYCVAALKSPHWDKLIEQRKIKSQNYFKTKRQLDDYAKLFRLQMGVCLPDSCESATLDRHREELVLLVRHALADSGRFGQYELADLYCLPDEESPLRQWSGSAWAFLALVGAWALLVLLVTLADCCELAEPGRLVGWLSLRANYRKLMHVSSDEHDGGDKHHHDHQQRQQRQQQQQQQDAAANDNQQQVGQQHTRVNLRFLNAFKVIVMFWIINGHIMLLMIQTAKNILASDALLNGLMHFLIGATFGVDLFFTMTGFLTAYLLFDSGHARRMRPSTWLYLTCHRYWRLAPLYLLAFWFSRSVMQQLGSGPLWDYGTSALTYRGLCNQESWWYPLTLTSNLHGLFEECMITSWYISCDMQFWLVSPLFLYLLAKRPSAGWLAALATIIASSRIRYQAILGESSARHDELVQPRADIFMRVSHDLPALYTHPHHRIPAYLVGLLAGHYVYMIKSRQWGSSLLAPRQATAPTPATKTTTDNASRQHDKGAKGAAAELAARRRNLLAYTGTTLFLLMAFVSYLLSHYYPAAWLVYARPLAALGYAVDHLLMSVGAALVITAMCFGQWPRLTAILSHPNWTRISKINYALLLLQCEAIYFQVFRYEQVPVAGTRELLNILFNLLVTLYPLAFLITLFIEFPLANLEKLLLGGGRKQSIVDNDKQPQQEHKLKQKLNDAKQM